MISNPQLERLCALERVGEILAHLSPEQFEAVAMAFEGASPNEIGQALGLTRQAAHSRLKFAGKAVARAFPEHADRAQGSKRLKRWGKNYG